jgi:hypothetical protein
MYAVEAKKKRVGETNWEWNWKKWWCLLAKEVFRNKK